MSKFIRLTLQDGRDIALPVEKIDWAGQAVESSLSYLVVAGRDESVFVKESVDQILTLIEGDESGLRERVAFLTSALAELECVTNVWHDESDKTINTDRSGILGHYDECPHYVKWAKEQRP